MYNLQPEKKSSGCIRVLAVIGALALVLIGGVVMLTFFAMSGSATSVRSSTSHQVVYKVTTSRDWDECYGFDATYEMSHGTSQRSVSICEGKRSAVVDQRSGSSGDFVYLSVQNDEQSATIGCEIYIDGKLAYQTRSEGQYVIASCSGSIP